MILPAFTLHWRTFNLASSSNSFDHCIVAILLAEQKLPILPDAIIFLMEQGSKKFQFFWTLRFISKWSPLKFLNLWFIIWIFNVSKIHNLKTFFSNLTWMSYDCQELSPYRLQKERLMFYLLDRSKKISNNVKRFSFSSVFLTT